MRCRRRDDDFLYIKSGKPLTPPPGHGIIEWKIDGGNQVGLFVWRAKAPQGYSVMNKYSLSEKSCFILGRSESKAILKSCRKVRDASHERRGGDESWLALTMMLWLLASTWLKGWAPDEDLKRKIKDRRR
jgi:hypothetical protein